MPDDLRELAAKLLAGIAEGCWYCGCAEVIAGCCACCGDSRKKAVFTGDVADLERLLRAIAEPKEI